MKCFLYPKYQWRATLLLFNVVWFAIAQSLSVALTVPAGDVTGEHQPQRDDPSPENHDVVLLFSTGRGVASQPRSQAQPRSHLNAESEGLNSLGSVTLKQESTDGNLSALCPPPVLERLSQHQVSDGDTIESIAAHYNLIPATLIGFNPQLNSGPLSPGTQLAVPPHNGVRVEVSHGDTWQDLADRYNVRADVLFEANGCADVPSVAFIPGINWSPATGASAVHQRTGDLPGYPLPAIASVLRQYGWQAEPGATNIEFHSGVDLNTVVGTSVLSVGDGIVAFAGEQGSYGKLVVINHAQGLQSRYAQLETINVTQGDMVQSGQTIGTSGNTGNVYAPHLHFEIRENSNLGWVAQDPALYLENMRMFDR